MDQSSNREAVKAQFLAKADEVLGRISAARSRMEAAKAEIEAGQQDFHALVLGAKVWKLDLIQDLEIQFSRQGTDTLAPPLTIPSQPARPTVREFILERAEAAAGQPVRALGLRTAYLEAYGNEVHPKTFGMTLYRLSKEGFMRREGHADWYWVPPEKRVPVDPTFSFDDAEIYMDGGSDERAP